MTTVPAGQRPVSCSVLTVVISPVTMTSWVIGTEQISEFGAYSGDTFSDLMHIGARLGLRDEASQKLGVQRCVLIKHSFRFTKELSILHLHCVRLQSVQQGC